MTKNEKNILLGYIYLLTYYNSGEGGGGRGGGTKDKPLIGPEVVRHLF